MTKKILNLLEKDARYTAKDISQLLNIDENIIKEEIERLEEIGIIKGYKALIDWDKADVELLEAMIELKVCPQKGVGFDKIAMEISKFPEVRSVYLMSGGFDLTVIVRGTSMKDIAMFVGEKLSTLDTVMSTATHFFLNDYKVDGKLFYSNYKDERVIAF